MLESEEAAFELGLEELAGFSQEDMERKGKTLSPPSAFCTYAVFTSEAI